MRLNIIFNYTYWHDSTISACKNQIILKCQQYQNTTINSLLLASEQIYEHLFRSHILHVVLLIRDSVFVKCFKIIQAMFISFHIFSSRFQHEDYSSTVSCLFLLRIMDYVNTNIAVFGLFRDLLYLTIFHDYFCSRLSNHLFWAQVLK